MLAQKEASPTFQDGYSGDGSLGGTGCTGVLVPVVRAAALPVSALDVTMAPTPAPTAAPTPPPRPPTVTINPLADPRVIVSQKLTLTTTIDSMASEGLWDVSWKVDGAHGSTILPVFPPSKARGFSGDIDLASASASEAGSQDLVIRKDSLRQGHAYQFQVTGTRVWGVSLVLLRLYSRTFFFVANGPVTVCHYSLVLTRLIFMFSCL